MSYIFSQQMQSRVKRRVPMLHGLGELNPDMEVPGTGQTVADLRKIGWTDDQILQVISGSPELAIAAFNQAKTKDNSNWFGREAFTGSGITNGYVMGGAGLLLVLALLRQGKS